MPFHKTRVLTLIRATTVKKVLSKRVDNTSNIKKLISEKKALLEKIELKFINDQISEDLYQKHSKQINGEISQLTQELESTSISSSNLETAVDKCLSIAENISHTWVTARYENRQKLQRIVFPDGIMYNKQNDQVRTLRVNSLFAAIPLLTSVLEENKKRRLVKESP